MQLPRIVDEIEKKSVFLLDRGILSTENMKLLSDKGRYFIARVKSAKNCMAEVRIFIRSGIATQDIYLKSR
ncbi:MAG: hypothetical protein HQK52_18125 [Oligoflexia bacterium]|nr:hypothetical protein [Oligoflexia bacterium]